MEEELLRAKSLAESEPDEAMRICCDVLNQDLDGLDGQRALFMIGFIMMEARRYGFAYQIFKRCADVNPKVSEIYSNMGMCLEPTDAHGAVRLFQKAYQLRPDNSHAYANEALIHLQTGRPDKCITLSEKALEYEPDLMSAKHNLGLAQIMERDFKSGWANYFDTLGVKQRKKRDYGLPEWDGKAKGEVVIYGEQGVGDEVMFASCLADVQKTNNVILDCDKRLEGLFKRSFDFPVYGTRFKKETPILDNHSPQYQIAMGQLPHFYRNDEDSFPGTPYLKPDPELVIKWNALFDTFKGRKIGVAWSGGLPETGLKRRTLDPSDFEPLFNDEDTFICLEYKEVSNEILDKYNLKYYPRSVGKGQDIDELAGIIACLDVVVTACTTVVYIAGALNIPCVVLVPREAGYRYHSHGQFPWYNSVELVRQRNSWKKTVKEAVKIANKRGGVKCL